MGETRKRKNRITRVWMICLPLAIGLIVTIIVNSLILTDEKFILIQENLTGTINTTIGLWAGILGFEITAISILISLYGSSEKKIKQITDSRHFGNVIFSYIVSCFFVLACLFIFLPLVITRMHWSNFLLRLFFACAISSLVYIFVNIFLLALVLSTYQKPSGGHN